MTQTTRGKVKQVIGPVVDVEFSKNVNQNIGEIAQALQHQKIPNYGTIHFMDRELINCIQRARSRKVYIDIDFDIDFSKCSNCRAICFHCES